MLTCAILMKLRSHLQSNITENVQTCCLARASLEPLQWVPDVWLTLFDILTVWSLHCPLCRLQPAHNPSSVQ